MTSGPLGVSTFPGNEINVGDKGAVVMLKTLNLQKLGTFCLRPVHAFLDLVPVDLAEDRVSVPDLLVVYTHKLTHK